MTTLEFDISADQIEAEVLRLADAYPDTIYDAPEESLWNTPKCSYIHGKAGPSEGCIFGQALQNLGVPQFVLKYHDGTIGPIDSLCKALNLPYRDYWGSIQSKQDCGKTWGEAVQVLKEG